MDKALEKQIQIFMAKALAEGKTLSEIQTLVNAEFKQNLTYMEVRILASTLDVDWKALDPNKKPESKVAEPAAEAPAAEEAAAAAEPEAPAPAPAAAGTTKVELSKIARPGMMFSGSVTFANGSTAEWFVDQAGRPGLGNLVGAEPTQADLEAFGIELNKVLTKAMGR